MSLWSWVLLASAVAWAVKFCGYLVPVRWLGFAVDLPVLHSIDLPSLVLALASAIAIFRFKLGMVPVLLGSSWIGIIYWQIAHSV